MALLDMLWQMKARLQIEVAAAHYEHGIRGEDSLGDAAFVQEFCRQQGIAFYLGSGNVPLEASQKMNPWKQQLEECAMVFFMDFGTS